MRILIICSSGMSSSVLVTNMQDAAIEMNMLVEIEALGRDEFSQISTAYDVILLAPQIRYQKERFEKMTHHEIPITIIDSVAYGMLDGQKVLQQAIDVTKNKN